MKRPLNYTKIVFYISIIVLFALCRIARGEESNNISHPEGTIKGRVIDTDTRAIIPGVNIHVIGADINTSTDTAGCFKILNVHSGRYSLQFSHIGYESVIKTNIIVPTGGICFVNTELKTTPLKGDNITVTSEYFPISIGQSMNPVKFSSREICYAAALGEDINRAINILPGITQHDDYYNNMIVRGGNPIENGFYVDNFEIANINHYASQGSPGGLLNLLNIDLVSDLDIYTGGFPALYGNKLSSIMKINYREGRRDKINGQFDFNSVGISGIIEGPLPGKQGSWLLSARRGFYDWLMEMIDIDVIPDYYDFQGKVVYDVSLNDRISFLGIAGKSDVIYSPDAEISIGRTGEGLLATQSIYSRTKLETSMEQRQLFRCFYFTIRFILSGQQCLGTIRRSILSIQLH